MQFHTLKVFKRRSLRDYGFFSFLLGILFLPSAMVIGILFLIPAFIAGCFIQKKQYLKDYWNFPFLIFGFFLLLSTFSQNFLLSNKYIGIWDPKLSLIGLGNWLPFIWIFWAAQPYLNSKSRRKSFSLILISGTIPILFSGFGQYFLNWTGPFETLNGLIIWYQKPVELVGGLSGLFSNQNYTGSWLNIVWPFCLALFLQRSGNFFRQTFVYSFIFSTGLATILTFSRSAWLGLLASIPFVSGKKGFFTALIILIIFLLTILLLFSFSPVFSSDLQNILRDIFGKILLEFSDQGYDENLYPSRLSIYTNAIDTIKENPIFGAGAALFPYKFQSETNFWIGHSHNLLFELAISYGLPSAILMFTIMTRILFLSGKNIFNKNKILDISLFDKAFWSATSFFLFSQLVDIQYFDGKISIIFWILIAGLKNIIEENKSTLIYSNES